MNIKSNQALLAIVPVLLSMTMPVFAQGAGTSLVQKGAVNSVQLGKGDAVAKGGQCASGKFHGCGAKGMGGPQANAGGPGFHGRFEHGHRHHSMLSMLKGEYALTDVQKEKIFALKGQFLSQAGPKFLDLKTTERKLRDEFTQPGADRAQLLSLQNQINADKDAVSNLKLDTKLQEMSVLTDQQRQELRREFVEHNVRRG